MAFVTIFCKTLLMEIPSQLHSLFSASVEERGDAYVIEVPKKEVRGGDLQYDETYRVALLPSPSIGETAQPATDSTSERRSPEPPVEEGEIRTVEIEDLGDQGDGLTRVERGFVVIVPDTDRGEQVIIEITDVRENVAFAEVVERLN